MKDLFKAAPYVRMHKDRVVVVKVGGATIAKPALLKQLARQIAVIHALGARVVVVHGGGPQIDQLQRMLGEEPRMIDGRRVTSAVALRALRLAMAGELNGDLSAALLEQGTPAIGIVAGSCGALVARRRAPMKTSQGLVDFGEVGDLTTVDVSTIVSMLDAGRVPVVAPIASDGAGGSLNINADLAAAALAGALGASKLVLVTSAPGILRSVTDPGSLVSALSLAELADLEAAGSFEGGMRVKAQAIRAALDRGVLRVHVVSGLDPEALLVELYTTHGSGTLVTREPERAPEPVATLAASTDEA
jgi:acetylglutamate kinase